VFHCYVIEIEKRDELVPYLAENGVPSIIHYPIPVHLQKAYEFLSYREGAFPVTEKLCRQVVSLPMYPEMPEDHIDYVCDTIRRFLSS
jgi:dTDP-4-amino-4,6-dideoxygalactose transaminase